jgi:hypothetical protein
MNMRHQQKDLANTICSEAQGVGYEVHHGNVLFKKEKSLGDLKSIDCAIRFAKHDDVRHSVVASIDRPIFQEGCIKATRWYTSFPTPQDFARRAQGQNAFWYEVLPSDLARYMYFDLDSTQDGNETVIDDALLETLIQAVFDFLREHVDCTAKYNADDVQIATASGMTQKGMMKYSFHVKLPFGFIDQPSMKLFTDSFFPWLASKYPQVAAVTDRAPYGKNQTYRALRNAKLTNPNRVLVPYHSSSEYTEAHMVGIYSQEDLAAAVVDVSALRKEKPNKTETVCDSQCTNYSSDDCYTLPSSLLLDIVCNLRVDRMTDYQSWRNAMFAVVNAGHVAGYPCEDVRRICHLASKLSSAYCPRGVDMIVRNARYYEYGPSATALVYWLRRDNAAAFNELRLRINESLHKRFSVAVNLKASYASHGLTAQNICEPYVPAYDLDNFDCCVLQSHPGTGKTYQLRKLFGKHSNILALGARQTYSHFFVGAANACGAEFRNYIHHKHELACIPRLAIQMESLWRLKERKWDLVILDEMESLLKQFDSDTTFTRMYDCQHVFWELLVNTRKVIIMDAFIGDRTLRLLQKVRQARHLETRVVVNDWRPPPKKARRVWNKNLGTAKKIFVQLIVEDLRKGKRLVLFSATKAFAKHVDGVLTATFGLSKMVMCYSADSDDTVFETHMANINSYWTKFDCVIYTPKILAGVSFDIKGHFDNLFLFGYNGSTVVRDVWQAAIRVRHFTNPDIVYLLDTSAPAPPEELLTEQGVRAFVQGRTDFFQRMYIESGNMDIILKERAIHGMLRDPLAKDEDIITARHEFNKMLLERKGIPEWLLDVRVQNQLEENMSRAYYAQMFSQYLKDLNYEHDDPVTDFIEGEPIPMIHEKADYEIRSDTKENLARFLDTDVHAIGVAMKYMDIEPIEHADTERIMPAIYSSSATAQEKWQLHRYFFDRMMRNPDATPQEKALVFDAMHESTLMKKHIAFINKCLRVDVSASLQTSAADNPYLEMTNHDLVIVGLVRKLCGYLGLQNCIDTNTVIHAALFDTQAVVDTATAILENLKVDSREVKHSHTLVGRVLRNTVGGGLSSHKVQIDKTRARVYKVEYTDKMNAAMRMFD